MPTAKYLDQVPAFPSDIPIAAIPTVSLQSLKNADREESAKLFDACQDYGFFLLDLANSVDGSKLLDGAESMFDICSSTLSLDVETLSKYSADVPKDLIGYKKAGMLKTGNGKYDAMELYTISQDDMLGNAPRRQNPDPIETQREKCGAFIRNAYDAVCIVFSTLDKCLGLPPGTLKSLSPIDKPSATSLRLLMSHPQSEMGTKDDDRVVLGGHTDIGTITMLFHMAGGLQILPAGSENVNENWRYIRPQSGCALVNLGDTIVEWTGGLFRSSLHRVVDPPGKQETVTRMSLAYLIRPEYNGSMRRLKGSPVIPALVEGEEDETRSASEWATWRAGQIVRGELKSQTIGGRPVRAA